MTKEKLEEKYNLIDKYISQKRLKDAYEELLYLVDIEESTDIRVRYDFSVETYHNILKYTIMGVDDPERGKVYQRLQLDMMRLTDDVKNLVFFSSPEIPVYQIKSDRDAVAGLTYTQLNEIWKSIVSADNQNNAEVDDQIRLFFNKIWFTNRMDDEMSKLLGKIAKTDKLKWNYKSLLVSALTLSLFRFFDLTKFELLFKFYKHGEEQIWQRALVGIVMSLFKYEKRYGIFTDLQKMLSKARTPEFEKHVEMIAIQFIRTQETEKIAKKLHDEIMPEMAKISPKIAEKLDLENILGDDMSDDKNPDWEMFFDDSPELFEKMGELSMMQMEGADVFMTTFSMLKHFAFFNQIRNWFMPFYPENQVAGSALDGAIPGVKAATLLKTLSQVPFICNSDKYSFCLNVGNLPEAQRQMLTNLFMAELEQMDEIASDEKITKPDLNNRYIITQYIQDLYRFYKLHPLRKTFTDIFALNLDMFTASFGRDILTDKNAYRRIAEFNFEKGYFEPALRIFKFLMKSGVAEYEIYQKAAFAYQKMGDYQQALELYLQAELFDQNRAWNLKKIAYCQQKLKQPEKALHYYQEVEKLEPENLMIQANIGRCYLDMRDYEEALKYYYKVEYLAPNNHKVWRPIAWCSFVQGKLDAARKYLKKIIPVEGNKHDYLNLGHVELADGNKDIAVENYKMSINQHNNDLEEFLEAIQSDIEYLEDLGVQEDEVPLVIDYIRYQYE